MTTVHIPPIRALRSEPLTDEGQREPPRARFEFLDDVEIEKLPPPTWLVTDILPESGFGVLYSPPEGGKSFLALALAFSVATGRSFYGHTVKRGPVVYIAAEGSSGLPVRVGAWKHSQEWYERAGVHFLTEPVQLLDTDGREVGAFLAALAKLPVPPSLIVIDTLHRCMAGGDENSAKDMGIAIAAIDLIRRSTRAAILLVHHTRKDGDMERGSTSLRGAADMMLSLKREQARVTVICEKQKDAAHFPPFTLEIVSVEDSCVLIGATGDVAGMTLFPGDPKFQILSALHEGAMPEDGLSTSAWLQVAEKPPRTFMRARKFLVTNGYVVSEKSGRSVYNKLTSLGIQTITDNCHVTAK
jgi:hypothetical protein